MHAYVEVWGSALPEAVALQGERVTVGKATSSDIALEDPTISHLHAAFELFGSGWCITDLGSRNGTYVQDERILGPRALRAGDEIRIGGVRLVFRDEKGKRSSTQAAEPAPKLTPRERDVLLALCRPVLSGDLLTEPASIRAIASELVLSEDAVKKHLGRLYAKFQITEAPRKGRLANDAIRRGAVSLGDLRAPPGGG